MIRKTSLYNEGNPISNFNQHIIKWLNGEEILSEHNTPAAFTLVREKYDSYIDLLMLKGISEKEAHKKALSNLTTEILLATNIKTELMERLSDSSINESGARTQLSQGMAKNSGENFVNLVIYSIAKIFSDNDQVLVDKGTPEFLKKTLHLKRKVELDKNQIKTIDIPIECDFVIFNRSNYKKAIILNSKTRLKEVFHIGTMWKLFFDIAKRKELKEHWNLSGAENIDQIKYCFVTADMIDPSGSKSQGPDIPENKEPRNLIQMDASFFDYVFVSKNNPFIANKLDIAVQKEGLFHELSCLIDLINQVVS